MVKVSIRGWGMDYVWESLYKDRSARKCVCVCMLARINFLLILWVIFKAVWHLVAINLSGSTWQTCKMEYICLVTKNNHHEEPRTFHEQISQRKSVRLWSTSCHGVWRSCLVPLLPAEMQLCCRFACLEVQYLKTEHKKVPFGKVSSLFPSQTHTQTHTFLDLNITADLFSRLLMSCSYRDRWITLTHCVIISLKTED